MRTAPTPPTPPPPKPIAAASAPQPTAPAAQAKIDQPAPASPAVTTIAPTLAAEPLSHRQTIAWRVTVGVLFAYALTLFVPWAPAMPAVELDASWYMILHWAFLNRLDFGNEIVFTYGPLGFLFQGYHPSTFLYSVITWTLIATVCFLTMLRVIHRLPGRRWVKALLMLGFLAILGSSIRGLHDIRLFVTCWALLLLHFYVDDRPLTGLKVALVLALAIITLGKFSLAIVAFLVILVISIDLLARKIVPGVLYIYLGALTVLWLAAGQSPLTVISYLRHSLLISSGFAQGVGKDSPHEIRDVVMFVLCAMVLLGVIGWVHLIALRGARASASTWKDGRVVAAGLRAVLLMGVLVASLFLLFKIGYVRHDEHELLATTCLAAIAVMYLAVLWPMELPRLVRRSLVAATVACLLLMTFSFQVWVPWGLTGQLAQTLTRFPVRTWEGMNALVGSGANRQAYKELLSNYRSFRPLPPVTGTVDAVSWFQYSLLTRDMDYRPRPVIQGYLAYTPELGRINAEFLRSSRAPESVLFDMQAIDGYPTQGDASSLPELLGLYELTDASSGALRLTRPQRPRKYSRGLLQQITSRFGEWIPVPASGEPVWVSIRLSPTLAGRIAQTLYKPPSIYLNLKTGESPVAHAKLIPGIASEGFLLSPMVLDRMAFAMLWSDEWRELLKNLMVTQIQVVVEESGDSTYAYDSEFEVSFEELRFEHSDIMSVPGVLDYFRFEQFYQAAQPLTDTQKRGDKNEEWKPVLVSPPPSQWLLDVPQTVSAMQVSFGILKTSYIRPPITDGVEFRIYAANVLEDGRIEAQPLWSRRLDPAIVPADQGPQSAQIQLPSPPPVRLVLETVTGPASIPSQPYWGGVLFTRQE